MFKMPLFIKKAISYFLVFSLTFSNAVFAADGNEAVQRTKETIETMLKSSKPSDMPIAGVSDFFAKEKVHLIKNFDLSQYVGKKVFVGYGIYDRNEEHCKFIEQPGVVRADYDLSFHYNEKFNEHSYGVSHKTMNYSECKSLASKLGGRPLVLDSAGEGAFISGNFINMKKDGKTVGNVWLGLTRESCNTLKYTNAEDMNQDYFKWKDNAEPACDSNKLNYYLDGFGRFVPTSKNEKFKCVVEFSTPDMYRPIKVCAPWWRVLRDYDGVKQTLYDVNMLNRINQADIPMNLLVCTKYDKEKLIDPNTQPKRIAHCTEYYSRTIAPECLLEPRQAICKIDECKGYINNACTLLRKDSVGKTYVKGEILYNGKQTEAKNMVDIQTKEFECPARGMSSKDCIEQSNVVVYPKECPGSQCNALKTCVYEAGLDNEAISKCYLKHTCIKIYGGRDIPPKVDPATGIVTHLYGKCPTGEILEFPVGIEDKLDKKCMKYEIITKSIDEVEKCKEDRGYNDYEVNMAITDKDIYQDDPNCLRLDQVHDSQTKQSMIVKFTPKNFFKMKITQVNLDGTTVSIGDDMGDDSYIVGGAMAGSAKGSPVQATQKQVNPLAPKPSGKKIDPSALGLPSNCSSQEAWTNRNTTIFAGISKNDDDAGTGFTWSDVVYDNNRPYLFKAAVEDNPRDCRRTYEKYKKKIDIVATDKGTLKNGFCYFALPIVGFDSRVGNFSGNGRGSVFDLTDVGSEDKCLQEAYCLTSAASWNGGKCRIDTGNQAGANAVVEKLEKRAEKLGKEKYPDVFADDFSNAPDFSGDKARPAPGKSETRTAALNGIQSIYAFEDYVRGGWGWYSNHNAWPAELNDVQISVGGSSYQMLTAGDKRMSKITDLINYRSQITHIWWRAKKPNIAAGLISGAATTAAMLYVYGTLAAIPVFGWIAIVVIAVLSALFMGKSKEMDEQKAKHVVYKDVPINYYYAGLYETRMIDNKDALLKDNPNYNTDSRLEGKPDIDNKLDLTEKLTGAETLNLSGAVRLTYWDVTTQTGRDKPGKIKDLVRNVLLKSKHSVLGGLGFEKGEVYDHPWELGNWGGNYPKCKWYKPNCTKSNTECVDIYTPNSMIPYEFSSFKEGEKNEARSGKVKVNVPLGDMEHVYKGCRNLPKDKARKETTTVYLNAVNTLILLVPYRGDYDLTAYDKYGEVLSKQTITKDLFVKKSGGGIPSAQVLFGKNMQLAKGIKEGNACRTDRATEWGGGVSGTFFENQRTAESDFCAKSNDIVVKERAMVAIEVRPKNMDRSFYYKLKKPLPFANRVWLASLDTVEIRRYRCFDDFTGCDEDQYKKSEEQK